MKRARLGVRSTDVGSGRPEGLRESWVDVLQRAVEGSAGPAWLGYVLAWLALFALETAVKWWDGTYPVGTFSAFHAVFTASPVYATAIMHLLDRDADRAFASFQRALPLSRAELDRLHERLTTMPRVPVLIAFGLGVAWAAFLRVQLIPPYLDSLELGTSPAAMVVDLGILTMFWGTCFVLLYHSIRQLRAVSDAYAHADIDLFQPRPLYAFALLAAHTSIALLALAYAWFATVPGALENPVLMALVSAIGLFGIPMFVLPLVGIRQRLAAEKTRLLADVQRRARDTLDRFRDALDAGDLADMDALHKAVATLDLEQARIERMPTWPWHPATLRGVLTTVLLPLFVWSVQQALLRVFG